MFPENLKKFVYFDSITSLIREVKDNNFKTKEIVFVVGNFDKKNTLLDTLFSGFPAGTVSGAPKIRAMEIIDDLELTKRKLYAGGIGYFTPNNEMDTCIALRTALIIDNKIYVQSGAGIVADSVPIKEYKETVNKAKALFEAAN